MICKVCNSSTNKLFEKVILNKYSAFYYKCPSCDFMQTDEPIWISEAYSNIITSTDIGLLNRNLYLVKEIKKIIDLCFPNANLMLDYAGGYGVFVRLMRDEGYNFYRYDPYCENIFAKTFDFTDLNQTYFDLVTAFEVLEHFVDPITEIEKILTYSDNVIFSTVLIPNDSSELVNWWYLATETGQHVAFYSGKTMSYIADKYSRNYYCVNGNLHIFSKTKLNQTQLDDFFKVKKASILERLYHKLKRDNIRNNRQSLLQSDYELIKKNIN